MIVASFAEILSIGAVLPFLSILMDPLRVFEHAGAQPIINFLGIKEPKQLLLPLTVIFGLAALLAGGLRLLLFWVNTRLSFATGGDLSLSIYRRTLFQPYSVHVERNSSEIISGLSTKAGSATNSISMVLTILSSSIMLASIIIALLFVEPVITLVGLGGFGLIYAIITRLTRKQMLKNSQCIAQESTKIIQALQEGLGGKRDMLIDGTQDVYCATYSKSDRPLRRAYANNIFIGVSPRYGLEILGMIFVAGLAYSLGQQSGGIVNAIPIIGALTIGVQKLLPVMQQIYGAWSSIRDTQASLQDALDLLDQPLPSYANQISGKPLVFQKSISLENLSFRYGLQTPWVLKNLSLTIPKGSRVGFIGPTGSGKSTLLDVIMALLWPNNGALKIDGKLISDYNHREWQAHIAHVPQAIFLTDGTVYENIALGVPVSQINIERAQQAAQQAQIADDIDTWPKKYLTFVGERGIRLSGGQRQRIGIARAVYKQADVIILDEATSALDSETETNVMQAIDNLNANITVLIIAHRLSTLNKCTFIVELNNGGIQQMGSYREIVEHKVEK